jgi:hypothetical protein
MANDWLPYHRLLESGWELNKSRGVQTQKFTSVSLCLTRGERLIVCVQGYGRTRSEALADVTAEANSWLKTHPADPA